MLPAPKNKAPVLPAPERVLGGGRGPGLVFNAHSKNPRTATVEDAEDEDGVERHEPAVNTAEDEGAGKPASIPLLPPHLARGKANVSVEERHELPKAARHAASSAPTVDFFSLGMHFPRPQYNF